MFISAINHNVCVGLVMSDNNITKENMIFLHTNIILSIKCISTKYIINTSILPHPYSISFYYRKLAAIKEAAGRKSDASAKRLPVLTDHMQR